LLSLSWLDYPPMSLTRIKKPIKIAMMPPVLNPPRLDFGAGEYEELLGGVNEYELLAGDFFGADVLLEVLDEDALL